MLKSVRVHTKRVYVRRRRKRAQNRTVLDFERVYFRQRTSTEVNMNAHAF